MVRRRRFRPDLVAAVMQRVARLGEACCPSPRYQEAPAVEHPELKPSFRFEVAAAAISMVIREDGVGAIQLTSMSSIHVVGRIDARWLGCNPAVQAGTVLHRRCPRRKERVFRTLPILKSQVEEEAAGWASFESTPPTRHMSVRPPQSSPA